MEVARSLLGRTVEKPCKLTGVRWFAAGGVALTNPVYGAAMVVDTLSELIQAFLGWRVRIGEDVQLRLNSVFR